MSGIINIHDIQLKTGFGRARVVCNYDVMNDPSSVCDGLPDGEGELYCETIESYGDYLVTEVADAFVMALLKYSMLKKYDIRSAIPISSHLFVKIKNELIPALALNPMLNIIKIDAPKTSRIIKGKYVGAAYTGGIDSSHVLTRYVKSDCQDYNITHLVRITWGGGPCPTVMGGRLQKVTIDSGLPIIPITCNFREVIPTDFMSLYVDWIYTIPLVTRKLWKTFIIGSGYALTDFKITIEDGDHYQPLLSQIGSGKGLEIITDGLGASRVEKTRTVINNPFTYRHLDVCGHPHPMERNCSWCDKCIRTLLTIDALGDVSNYSEVFDVEEYRSEKQRYVEYMCIKKDKSVFFRDIYSHYRIHFPELILKSEHEISKMNISSKMSTIELLTSLLKYHSESGDPYALYRLIQNDEMIHHVHGSEKDPIDYCLEKIVRPVHGYDHDGITTLLWKMWNKKHEATYYHQLLSMAENHNPLAMLFVGRIYRDGGGNGIGKDLNTGLKWLKKASESGNTVALNEYHDLVMKNGLADYYDSMYAESKKSSENGDSGSMYRLAQMYYNGYGVQQNKEMGLYWARCSYESGFPLALKNLIKLTADNYDFDETLSYYQLLPPNKKKTFSHEMSSIFHDKDDNQYAVWSIESTLQGNVDSGITIDELIKYVKTNSHVRCQVFNLSNRDLLKKRVPQLFEESP